MKNFIKISLIFVGMAVVTASFSSLVFAASGGVGGRPANPDPDNPRTQSIFIFTLTGGSSKGDQVYLSNGGDTDQVVQLYATDGIVSNTGAFTCKQEVEPKSDVGAMISLSKNEVNVPANGSVLVDFTLSLPEKADVGEHDGCIVIQKKEENTQQTGSIQVHTRTAVRVVVIVPGDIHREVSISDFSAKSYYLKGDKTYVGPNVSFNLKNTGNVSADVAVSVRIKDAFGNNVSAPGSSNSEAFFSGQYPVIAGSSFQVNYDSDFQPFFGGWYKVKADIVYNKVAGTFGVNDAAGVLRAETSEVTIFFLPSPVLFAILALMALSYVWFYIWKLFQRREARRWAKKSLKRPSEKAMWGLYEVKEGDTLQDLARTHGVPTNKIVIMNRLQSSELTPGQKIYLPHKQNKL